jgi:spermidine dehydrogenase
MLSDRELGMHRRISRRQFCQGTAVALGASLAPWAQASGFNGSPEMTASYYPPAKTGLRGAHAGSFETAHALVHQGRRWDSGTDTGEGQFDLVVVGAGISGLAAAWFYRQQKPHARILVLDNHDDFGGHAKRNEFTHQGKTYIGYGGSQSIDTPSSYSPEALGLLKSLGIELDRFYTAFHRKLYQDYDLRSGFWLDREHFGVDRLVRGNPLGWGRRGDETDEELQWFADKLAKNKQDSETLFKLLTAKRDLFPDKSPTEKFQYLRSLSYEDYLRSNFGLSEYLLRIINPLPDGLWGVGTDGISARECLYLGLPGFSGLGLNPEQDDPYFDQHGKEPYIFHFPDGNAGIARLLVRSLLPGIAPGDSMEDIVRAPFDYAALDHSEHEVKIRLNATAVRIAHRGELTTADSVDVRYVKDGSAHDVNARQVIFAGYSAMIPHVCPEFPSVQAEAFASQVKIPLLYANMLVRDWQPFAALGVDRIQFPGGLMNSVSLDFPVSLGGYEFAKTSAEPMILHWDYFPTQPGQGLDARTQNKLGRQKMLALSFADYERAMRLQARNALADGGFDPARDIVAITVNRWPHGYAYEYNDLVDAPEFNRYNGPHVAARQPFGRVSIAGSDAEAFAYVNGAIDSAWRAVRERLGAG